VCHSPACLRHKYLYRWDELPQILVTIDVWRAVAEKPAGFIVQFQTLGGLDHMGPFVGVLQQSQLDLHTVPTTLFPETGKLSSGSHFNAELPIVDMARFAVFNSEDQRAAVWVVSILLLSYTTLTTLVRGVVKLKMMGLDDGVAGLAQLLTYGNVASVVYALHNGLSMREAYSSDGQDARNYGKFSQQRNQLLLQTDTDVARRCKQALYYIFLHWRRRRLPWFCS
jgi:hypothetical protein